MLQAVVEYIPYIAILIACSFAVVSDVRSRRIPNAIPLSLAVCALVFRAAHGPEQLLTAAGALIGALLVGLVFFSLRLFGGGDIKLLAAGCAFMPLGEDVYFLLYTAVGGGILAIATAVYKNTLKQTISGSLAILHGFRIDLRTRVSPLSQTTLPYAIAITFGALSVSFMHIFDPAALRII